MGNTVGEAMIDLSRFHWFNKPTAVSEEEVAVFERAVGISFSADFRWFVSQFSGASPDCPTDFDFDDRGRVFSAAVGTFLTAQEGRELSLHDAWMYLSEKVPRVVPIALGGGGDYVALGYRDNATAPTVVFWNHGRQGLVDEVSLVAATFTKFVGALY